MKIDNYGKFIFIHTFIFAFNDNPFTLLINIYTLLFIFYTNSFIWSSLLISDSEVYLKKNGIRRASRKFSYHSYALGVWFYIFQSVNYQKFIPEFFSLFAILNPKLIYKSERTLIEKIYDYLLHIIKPE
jgi:hypothetical protein